MSLKPFVMGCLCGTALLMQASTTSAQTEPQSATVAERGVNAPDLQPLLKRFLTPQGLMDPAFPRTVAKPSPYCSDFFGLQAIADIPRDRIVADLVPNIATRIAEDANSVTLKRPRDIQRSSFRRAASK